MIPKDIRIYVIRPALQVVSLWSDALENLVYGTGLIETNYDALVQDENPPNGGLGFWQDEPSDYNDLYAWLRLNANRGLMERVLSACYYSSFPTDPMVLVSNIRFACLICALHYYRANPSFPIGQDAKFFAAFYKKHYNSSFGKSPIERDIAVFERVLNGTI